MQIITKDKAISITKPEGTNVDYYIFDEYEIHHNEIPPGSKQVWHHHEKIEETIYIISGSLKVQWIENGAKKEKTVSKGDVIRVEDTPHNFTNSSDRPCKFIVFRLVLQTKNFRELIKNDKHLDSDI